MIESALATASGTADKRATADVLVQRLASAPAVRATLDEVERETAQLAKEQGATWAQIGAAFGITPEAAIYRFTGANARRQKRNESNPKPKASPEEPLAGESITEVAKREGVSPTTFRNRAKSGAYPQYKLVETIYRGRPATRVETV